MRHEGLEAGFGLRARTPQAARRASAKDGASYRTGGSIPAGRCIATKIRHAVTERHWRPRQDCARRERARAPRMARVIEPAARFPLILASQRKSAAQSLKGIGGQGRNRTGVRGFAVRCMTTLPPGRWTERTRRVRGARATFGGNRIARSPKRQTPARRGPENLERETRLELATPTLARSCSTN